MKNKNLDGLKLSLKLKEKYLKIIKDLPSKPKLVVIQIGNDQASNIYINNKKRICEDLKLGFEHLRYSSSVKEEEIEKKIKALNNDDKVDGIMIQLPLPSKFNSSFLINLINPLKDVDGLTSTNMGNLVNNIPFNVSCTALGIMEILKEYNVSLFGKEVVIVGRSILIGKPLIHLLLNEDATITVCHSKTKDLIKHTKKADILIVAVGKPKFIKKEMIKKEAILIDVGINRSKGKIVGDIDYLDVFKKCSFITPVPKGVGPMTIMMLINNLLNSYSKIKKDSD
ncbi:MAG: bifunctional 5,10-methylenetetrahydrofolate dehydrogenase/5,10-methenyltetrahydrofolate cyclohydrolase [Bacilli bacterium]|jgi:methylenetetrahydrofolate dehydrogenase (NADP+)/methenyltetrahydrofolate cyclohydrolase